MTLKNVLQKFKIKRERERVKSKSGFTLLEISNSSGTKKLKGKNRRQSKSLMGFTLIELLIVIAIIGLLSSVVLASLNSARKKARIARAASDLNQLLKVLALYQSDNNGNYPCFDHNWNDIQESNWSSPYISKWPKNPWNTEYHWEHSQQGLTFSISLRDVPVDEAQMLDKAIDDNIVNTGILRFFQNPARVEYGGMDQTVSFNDCHG